MLLLHQLLLPYLTPAHAAPLQVFVANPTKPQPVIDILVNNREKLLKYLEDFHTDKGESAGPGTTTECAVGHTACSNTSYWYGWEGRA
jgi:hypothetical protein